MRAGQRVPRPQHLAVRAGRDDPVVRLVRTLLLAAQGCSCVPHMHCACMASTQSLPAHASCLGKSGRELCSIQSYKCCMNRRHLCALWQHLKVFLHVPEALMVRSWQVRIQPRLAAGPGRRHQLLRRLKRRRDDHPGARRRRPVLAAHPGHHHPLRHRCGRLPVKDFLPWSQARNLGFSRPTGHVLACLRRPPAAGLSSLLTQAITTHFATGAGACQSRAAASGSAGR